MSSRLFLFLLFLLLVALASCKEDTIANEGAKQRFTSKGQQFIIDTLAKDLQIPFGMDWLPDGRIIFTERARKDTTISLLDTVSGRVTRLRNTPTAYNVSDGGILDVLVHPDYKNNGWIYYSYSFLKEDSSSTLIIERAKISNDSLVHKERIVEVLPYYKSQSHFGNRLLIKDNYLFITMGDRYDAMDSSQTLSNHFGKILRVRDDGTIPADNPFASTKGAKAEIWSYGHRNPQGLAIHPVTGELWEHEHGPQGGDEINIIKPGLNYGWPVITYGEEYGGGKIGEGLVYKEGMQQPHYFYRPSIAPCGMTFYTGDKFPAWKGSLFLGSLAYRHLNHLTIKGDTIVQEERIFTEEKWRVRVVKQGPDGLLYLGTDNGLLIRIKPLQI